MASSSRGAAWGEKETKTLILMWGDIKIHAELDGKSRTKQVFEKISQKMTEEGYHRDGEQCKIQKKLEESLHNGEGPQQRHRE